MSGEVGSSGGDSNSGNDKRMGEAEGSTEWRKTPQMSRPDIPFRPPPRRLLLFSLSNSLLHGRAT